MTTTKSKLHPGCKLSAERFKFYFGGSDTLVKVEYVQTGDNGRTHMLRMFERTGKHYDPNELRETDVPVRDPYGYLERCVIEGDEWDAGWEAHDAR